MIIFRRLKVAKWIVFTFVSSIILLSFQNCGNSAFVPLTDQALGPSVGVLESSDLLKVTFANSVSGSVRNNSVMVNFTVEPPNAVMDVKCQLDSQPEFPCHETISNSGLMDGPHTLKVMATDIAGKKAVAAQSWTIDTTGPELTINDGPLSVTNSTSETIVFSALDVSSSVANIKCRYDSGPWEECASPIQLDNISLGDHSFSVIAQDDLGNVSSQKSVYWSVNTSGFKIDFLQTPHSISNETKASFVFEGYDSANNKLSIFSCSLDKSDFLPCNGGTVFYDQLTSGSHMLRIRGQNTAGQFSQIKYFSWKTTAEVPSITNVVGPLNCVYGSCDSIISFSASDEFAGLASITCSLNNKPGQPCSSPFIIPASPENIGVQTLSITAKNNAGNLAVAKYSWTVIEAQVSILGFNALKNIVTEGQSTTLSWKTLNAIVATLDGVPVNVNGSIVVTPSSSKIYTLSATGKSGAPITKTLKIAVTSMPTTIELDKYYTPSLRTFIGSSIDLAVVVKDSAGNSITGVEIQWSAVNGGSVPDSCKSSVTDGSGRAKCHVTLGNTKDTYTFVAYNPDSGKSLNITTFAVEPSKFEIYPVIGGSYYKTDQLSYVPKVYPGSNVKLWGLAYDAEGYLISNVPVKWSVTEISSGNTSPICPDTITSIANQLTSAVCFSSLKNVGGYKFRVAYGSTSTEVTLYSALPAKLDVGTSEIHYPGSQIKLGASARDAQNVFIANVPTTWTVVSGGAQLSSGCAGNSDCYATLGTSPVGDGSNTFQVTVPGLNPVKVIVSTAIPSKISVSPVFSNSGGYKPGDSILLKAEAYNANAVPVRQVPLLVTVSSGASADCGGKTNTNSYCSFSLGKIPALNKYTATVPKTSVTYTFSVMTVSP